MPRKDPIRERIENFAERREWTVQKAGGGYGLRNEEGRPVARVKPQQGSQFVVQYWSRRGRWKTPPRYPALGLPLEDALDLVPWIANRSG